MVCLSTFWKTISKFKKIYNDGAMMMIFGATLAVDSFFLMSGFLMSYLMLKQLDKTKGRTQILLTYLHRYIRSDYAKFETWSYSLYLYWIKLWKNDTRLHFIVSSDKRFKKEMIKLQPLMQIDSGIRSDHADVFNSGRSRRVRTLLVLHDQSVQQLPDKLVGEPALHKQLHRHQTVSWNRKNLK
jgi:hypothetical protein